MAVEDNGRAVEVNHGGQVELGSHQMGFVALLVWARVGSPRAATSVPPCAEAEGIENMQGDGNLPLNHYVRAL